MRQSTFTLNFSTNLCSPLGIEESECNIFSDGLEIVYTLQKFNNHTRLLWKFQSKIEGLEEYAQRVPNKHFNFGTLYK